MEDGPCRHFACEGGGISGSDSSSRYSKGSEGFRLYSESVSALLFKFSRTRDVVETVVVESIESRGEARESGRDELEGESCNNECFSWSRRPDSSFGAMSGLNFQFLFQEHSESTVVEDCIGEVIGLEPVILPVHSGAAGVLGGTEVFATDSVIASILVRFVLNRRRRGLSGEVVVPAS